MPIINTPSGPIMVDDGTPPDVIARIVQQHSTPQAVKQAQAAAPKPAPLSADQREVQRRVAEQRKTQGTGIFGQTGANVARRVANGFTFNFMDELNGGLHALGKIGQGTDAMAHEYRLARDTQRQLDHASLMRVSCQRRLVGVERPQRLRQRAVRAVHARRLPQKDCCVSDLLLMAARQP